MACNEIMNNNNNMINVVNDDHYDALSFCDLPIDNNTTELEPFFESSSSEDDYQEELFEFIPSPETTPNQTENNNAIIFCGKPIAAEKQPLKNNNNNNESLSSRLPKNGLFIRRDSSFKKSHSSRSDPISSPKSGSSSFRFGGPKAAPPATGSYHRSSSSSRKQMVMIGLVKLEPKMELSDIRKRQRRRNPVPMFPATGAAGDGNRKSGSGQGNHHWGLLGPLRCRVHLVSAFTKASFGCISHA